MVVKEEFLMADSFSYPENFIYFLGTGGARFSMVRQSRWTGGIWFTYGGLHGVIDPGPGSLCHICDAEPQLDAHSVRAILLTHRHLDHSSDMNVLAEAMTGGGFEKQGLIALTDDSANGPDPVLLRYIRTKAARMELMEDGKVIDLGCGVAAEPVSLVHHHVQCFGLIFRKSGLPTWGMISDTKPLDYLAERYRECSFVSVNTTFADKKPERPDLEHMSVADLGELLVNLHPKLAVMTHMGAWLVDAGPEKYAEKIQTPQTRVAAGQDRMVIDLDTLKIWGSCETQKSEREYRAIL